MKPIPAVLVTLAVSTTTVAAPQQQGESCALIDAAAQNQVITGQDSTDVGGEVITPPDKPTEMACLSSVIRKGGDNMISIPSVADIAGDVLDRACNALEEKWNEAGTKINDAASLPYGLIDIAGNNGYKIEFPNASSGANKGGVGDVIGGVNQGAGGVKGVIDDARNREKGVIDRTQDNVNIYGGSSSGSGSIYD